MKPEQPMDAEREEVRDAAHHLAERYEALQRAIVDYYDAGKRLDKAIKPKTSSRFRFIFPVTLTCEGSVFSIDINDAPDPLNYTKLFHRFDVKKTTQI
jgi:hypothetical protein